MARKNLKTALDEFLSVDENFDTYIETAMQDYLNGEEDNLILMVRHLIDKKGVQNVVKDSGISRATLKKNKEYKKKVNSLSKNRVHVCTTCGKTSKTNPEMEFRFCSRCDGNREYCAEHLFTHEHIKKIVINIDKDKSN